MKLTKLYMPTLREVPSDAEVESHKLLLRSGMIRKATSGIYTYLPLGYRVVRKIEQIVREEMDKSGAQEILMSAVQPAEIWQESGRWEKYGPEMFKLKDRNGRDFCLGPTAEEYFTELIKGEVNSYKQLPLNLYQIQTKYRDEKRPRFGINRAREFIMKDAYSFDVDKESMEKAYMIMYRAYERIFDRLELEYKVVEGQNGPMGGNKSHEFIALSETGEGRIGYSKTSQIAYSDEKAPVNYTFTDDSEPKDLKKVETKDTTSIDMVSKLLKVEKNKCLKAIDLLISGKPVFVFIPGDRELNFEKLSEFLNVAEHEIEVMDEETIKSCGTYPGFTGPINLKGQVIIDKSVTKIANLVVGANEKDKHYINANYKRDFQGQIADDLLMVKEGDIIPGTNEKYEFARGIEVGNIFQLGTKYSEALNVTYLDENGKSQNFYMGSYGVGVTRSISAIIEQYHDENGIIWPLSVAPYQVIVTVINPKDKDQMELGEKIYGAVENLGYEVILDDRDERAGVKFKDRDLIGIPLRITVGKKAKDSIVEFSKRTDGVNLEISSKEAVEKINNIIIDNFTGDLAVSLEKMVKDGQ